MSMSAEASPVLRSKSSGPDAPLKSMLFPVFRVVKASLSALGPESICVPGGTSFASPLAMFAPVTGSPAVAERA